MSKWMIYTLMSLILFLGVFFRFYGLSEIPPGLYPDEAMNGNNALEAITTGDFKWFYPENNGREGLFINIQAISIWIFGNEPWALRAVSALFGALTILGVYLLTKELFKKKYPVSSIKYQGSVTSDLNTKYLILNTEVVALLSSFFLATSYWHINFSRIGFRAIMVPFFATFGLYFLLKGLRTAKTTSLIAAGIFIGLGFHIYIAFRFMPFVIAAPILFSLAKWRREKNQENFPQTTNYKLQIKSCAPCAIALFLFITFIAALPMGYYFLQHPEDFVGRGGQVSIFATEQPLYEFAKSNILTAQMFFWKGDCNWRHNFNCQPELHPLVAIFFAVGSILLIKGFFKRPITYNLEPATLFVWLFFMSLPATLTYEGLPHALRAIGMIPPVMILAGLGAWRMIAWILTWLERKKERWPQNFSQIVRIQLELAILFPLILLWIPNVAFKDYFFRWGTHQETYFNFSTDIFHLGQYLNGLPPNTLKYVVVNMNGVEVHGIPMPAQTVMFSTDTFREGSRLEKNIFYLLPQDISGFQLPVANNRKVVIALLDGNDRQTKQKLEEKFPGMKFKAPGDFVIFTNTE